MGIPGILGQIGKGERVALAKLAIEHLEKTKRPLRIAIDAAIWNFQNAAGQGGKNPALRTLFFRLLKILALPIYPVFVYDGPDKPLTKRGRTVSRYGTRIENETAKQLLSQFRFPHHTAPGEAEAECAFLQSNGIVDAVMSQDVDAIMFGSTLTIRDWSKEGTRGNKTPTHVSVLDSPSIKKMSGIDPPGMILVALLSGGDYDEGVAGFGSSLACEIARAGFGNDLLELVRNEDLGGLKEWRERLQFELQTNESGYFKRRHPKLSLPDQFPNPKLLKYYTSPAVSSKDHLSSLEQQWSSEWKSDIDVIALRQYTNVTFDWSWRSGARRFVRCFAQPLFQDRLQRGVVQKSLYTVDNILEDRRHFTTGGIVELRFSAVPANIVGIDIEAEEDNPEYVLDQADAEDLGDEMADNDNDKADTHATAASGSQKKRAPWSPYAAEKWWIPSTLLKLSLGQLVEEWEQNQRDILSDLRKFATRKCPKPRRQAMLVDQAMESGAMMKFLGQPLQISDARDCMDENLRARQQSKKELQIQNSTLPRPRPSRVNEKQSQSIAKFFRVQKTTPGDVINQHLSCATLGDPEASARTPSPVRNQVNSRVQNTAAQSHYHCSPVSGQDGVEATQTHPNSSAQHKILDRTASTMTAEAKRKEEDLDHRDHNTTTEKRTRRLGMQQTGQGATKSQKQSIHLPPIASFFGTSVKTSSDQNKASKPSSQDSANAVKTFRLDVVARESLPGTWKELDNHPGLSQQSKRVSYIDLTND